MNNNDEEITYRIIKTDVLMFQFAYLVMLCSEPIQWYMTESRLESKRWLHSIFIHLLICLEGVPNDLLGRSPEELVWSQPYKRRESWWWKLQFWNMLHAPTYHHRRRNRIKTSWSPSVFILSTYAYKISLLITLYEQNKISNLLQNIYYNICNCSSVMQRRKVT